MVNQKIETFIHFQGYIFLIFLTYSITDIVREGFTISSSLHFFLVLIIYTTIIYTKNKIENLNKKHVNLF